MAVSSRRNFVIIAFAAGMSLGLLFASLSFISLQHKDSKNTLMHFTSIQAKLISSNVKGALSFEDAKDANAVLDTLKTQNCIAFAGIYDCNGKLFSYYCRDDVRNREFKLVPPYKSKIHLSRRLHSGLRTSYSRAPVPRHRLPLDPAINTSLSIRKLIQHLILDIYPPVVDQTFNIRRLVYFVGVWLASRPVTEAENNLFVSPWPSCIISKPASILSKYHEFSK